jgi:hypothetical protein
MLKLLEKIVCFLCDIISPVIPLGIFRGFIFIPECLTIVIAAIIVRV